jgi:hypothetical protein
MVPLPADREVSTTATTSSRNALGSSFSGAPNPQAAQSNRAAGRIIPLMAQRLLHD